MQFIAVCLLQMDDCRSIVKGVFAVKQRVSDNGFAQKKSLVPITQPLIDRFGDRSAVPCIAAEAGMAAAHAATEQACQYDMQVRPIHSRIVTEAKSRCKEIFVLYEGNVVKNGGLVKDFLIASK